MEREKIEQLRSERSDLVDKLERLSQLMIEESRDLDEEERADWQASETRLDELDSIIEKVVRHDARTVTPQEPKQVVPTGNIGVVRNERHDEKGEYRGFHSIGDFLQSVARSSMPGNSPDKRLQELRAATGMGENIGADGGFLVQSDFAEMLFNSVQEESNVASDCRTIPLSGNSNQLTVTLVDESSRASGSRFGGVTAEWAGEADSATASKPKLRQERINLEALRASMYASDELLADTSALGALISTAFSQEMAWKLDDAIINGDGAGKPLGILNSGALISVTRGTTDELNYVDVDGMVDRMHVGGKTRGKWYVHASVPQSLRNAVKVGTNSDFMLYMPAGGISGAQYDTLYGRPVVVTEQCKEIATVGDIIFADMDQYILIRRGGLEAAQSMHVRFINHEMTFRWQMRVNGQPLWRTTLTDANGSTTRSPFIAVTTDT